MRGTFFARFAALTRSNPPHANDYPILDRDGSVSGSCRASPFDIAEGARQT